MKNSALKIFINLSYKSASEEVIELLPYLSNQISEDELLKEDGKLVKKVKILLKPLNEPLFPLTLLELVFFLHQDQEIIKILLSNSDHIP